MTTSSVDREVLRAWRDTHNDVQPDRDGGHVCARLIWLDGRCAGSCGEPAKWFGRGRPFCQPCMVERIRLWSAVELGEVPA